VKPTYVVATLPGEDTPEFLLLMPFTPANKDNLIGMMLAPVIAIWAGRGIEIEIQAGWGEILTAGFLVGIGTRYAGGCTSGHGVCGISRGSVRSVAATLTFMAAGFATVFVKLHLVAA